MWVNALLFQTLNVCSDRESAPPVSSVWVSGFLSSYRVTFIFQWVLNVCCWGEGMVKMKVVLCWHDADVTLLAFFFESSAALPCATWLYTWLCSRMTDSRDYLNATITSVFFAIDFNCHLSLAFNWKSVTPCIIWFGHLLSHCLFFLFYCLVVFIEWNENVKSP